MKSCDQESSITTTPELSLFQDYDVIPVLKPEIRTYLAVSLFITPDFDFRGIGVHYGWFTPRKTFGPTWIKETLFAFVIESCDQVPEAFFIRTFIIVQ